MPVFSDFTPVSVLGEVEPWSEYQQRLRLLDRLPRLREVRQEIACTMHVPDLSEPGSFFFEREPLSLRWGGGKEEPELLPDLLLAPQQPRHPPEEGFWTPDEDLNGKVALWTGDMTVLACDAIVVPVYSHFGSDGTGLLGLAHARAGPLLTKECRRMGRCQTGQTVATDSFQLPCHQVFHTCPPPFRSPAERPTRAPEGPAVVGMPTQGGEDLQEAGLGEEGEEGYLLLQSCYETALAELVARGLRTLAFPCLGTGAKFGFPPVQAAHVALKTVRRWLDLHSGSVDRIVFVVKNARQEEIYEQLMRHYFPSAHEQARKAAAAVELTETQVEDMLRDLPSPPSSEPLREESRK